MNKQKLVFVIIIFFSNVCFVYSQNNTSIFVPALRYQGDLIMLAETEQLFNITPRWGILGFTGIGRAFDSIETMKSDEIVWNAGGGFRYLIAKALGLKVGPDIART